MLDTARIAFSFLPEGVALIVGLVLIVVRRKSDPQLAGLVAAGLALHLVAVVLGTVSVIAGSGLRTAADVERYAQLGGVLGIVVIFTRLLGWILLLFALFRRLPPATASKEAPTGRHALLDARGEQVVAEEGQTLYPLDDTLTPSTGLVAAGAGAAGAGVLGARRFGEDPYGDLHRDDEPPGSDTPTEAVPIGRLPLAAPSTVPPPDAPGPAGPTDARDGEEPEDPDDPDDVAEQDVHDPVEDEEPEDGVVDEPEDAHDPDEAANPAADPTEDPQDPGAPEPTDAEVAEEDVHDPAEDEAGEDGGVEDEVVEDGVVDVVENGSGPGITRPPWPALTATPVVRSDQTDDEAWETARTAVFGPDDVDAPLNLEVVDEPGLADLTDAELAELARSGELDAHPCVFVVDATATHEPGSPVLVVDLRGSGRTFRCAGAEVQAVEAGLSVADSSFARFADAAQATDDGIFRGL